MSQRRLLEPLLEPHAAPPPPERTTLSNQGLALREAREAMTRHRASELITQAIQEPRLGTAISMSHSALDLLQLLNAAKEPITSSHFQVSDRDSVQRTLDLHAQSSQRSVTRQGRAPGDKPLGAWLSKTGASASGGLSISTASEHESVPETPAEKVAKNVARTSSFYASPPRVSSTPGPNTPTQAPIEQVRHDLESSPADVGRLGMMRFASTGSLRSNLKKDKAPRPADSGGVRWPDMETHVEHSVGPASSSPKFPEVAADDDDRTLSSQDSGTPPPAPPRRTTSSSQRAAGGGGGGGGGERGGGGGEGMMQRTPEARTPEAGIVRVSSSAYETRIRIGRTSSPSANTHPSSGGANSGYLNSRNLSALDQELARNTEGGVGGSTETDTASALDQELARNTERGVGGSTETDTASMSNGSESRSNTNMFRRTLSSQSGYSSQPSTPVVQRSCEAEASMMHMIATAPPRSKSSFAS